MRGLVVAGSSTMRRIVSNTLGRMGHASIVSSLVDRAHLDATRPGAAQ